MDSPSFPNETQHIAIAGMTGSGKTVAALEMLAQRDMEKMAWIVIDHKKDDKIKLLPAEKLSTTAMFLPSKGLHVVQPTIRRNGRAELEDLLERIFKRGKIGVYIDEGHLMGASEAIRMMLVAGRSKKVPVMWTSQRASWIDSFIWSQSTFYRIFKLQTKKDVVRVQENIPNKWIPPEKFHSWYWDGDQGKMHYLSPSGMMENTLKTLDAKLIKTYRQI